MQPAMRMGFSVVLLAAMVPATVAAQSAEETRSALSGDPGLAPAEAPEPEPASPPPFVMGRERGIHYFRHGRAEAAKRELEAALKWEGAAQDHSLHYYLTRVHVELGEIEAAHISARQALEAAKTPEEEASTQALLDGLESFYGEAIFISPGPDAGPRRGFVVLDAVTEFINPGKKLAFAGLRDHLRQEPRTLPFTVYLPEGQYFANGMLIYVRAGEAVEVPLVLLESPGGEPSHMLWVAGGAAVVAIATTVIWLVVSDSEPKRSVQFEGTLTDGSPR